VDVAIREETQRLYNGTTTIVRHVTHAWETDPFNPLLHAARDALVAGGCEAKPGKWKLGRLGMATGGGLLVNDFGVPTIGYGPGDEAVAHARTSTSRCRASRLRRTAQRSSCTA